MKVVDIHTHLFPSEDAGRKAMRDFSPTGTWGCPEDLISLMDQGGIQRSVIVGTLPVMSMLEKAMKGLPSNLEGREREKAIREQTEKMAERLRRLNRYLCVQAKEIPRFIPFVAVSPLISTERMLELLDEAVLEGARGLKLHPMVCHYDPCDERLEPVYKWAAEKDLPLLFHGGRSPESPDVQYSHPDRFVDLANRHPQLTLIVAHLGQNFFEAAVELVHASDNVFLDTSQALTSVHGMKGLEDSEAVSLIRRIGCERVLFGSDYPWSDPAGDVERIRNMGFTEKELDAMLFGNASAILGS